MKRTVIVNVIILIIILVALNIISYFIINFYEYRYHQQMVELPAMINENYSTIQSEWFELETEYKSFIGWKRKPFEGKYTNIEKDGNRLTVQNESKSDEVIRFFGGSTMWGARVEDAHTIPSLFGLCIDDYKIVNHGETGFNSRQSLAYFINLIIKDSKTDIAVFYDGVNDVEHLCRKMIGIPGHGREVQMREELATVNSTQSYISGKDGIIGLSKKLISKIFIKNTAELIQRFVGKFLKKTPVYPYCCDSEIERAEDVANHLLNNWKVAHQIAKANGVQFIAILQPNIYTGKTKSDYLSLERSGLLENNFKEVYRILQKEIANYNWIYDFTGILDKELSPIYYDFCHLNEKGNKLIAESICQLVDKLKLEKTEMNE